MMENSGEWMTVLSEREANEGRRVKDVGYFVKSAQAKRGRRLEDYRLTHCYITVFKGSMR